MDEWPAPTQATFARMKTWKILRDCRLKGDGVRHAMLGIAHPPNLTLAGRPGKNTGQLTWRRSSLLPDVVDQAPDRLVEPLPKHSGAEGFGLDGGVRSSGQWSTSRGRRSLTLGLRRCGWVVIQRAASRGEDGRSRDSKASSSASRRTAERTLVQWANGIEVESNRSANPCPFGRGRAPNLWCVEGLE